MNISTEFKYFFKLFLIIVLLNSFSVLSWANGEKPSEIKTNKHENPEVLKYYRDVDAMMKRESLNFTTDMIEASKPRKGPQQLRGWNKWEEGDIVKGLLVDILLAKKNMPEINWDNLLPHYYLLPHLFQNMESDKSYEHLVSLLGYNFDKHMAFDLDCILNWKGEKIIPHLEKLIEKNENDCWKYFGKSSSNCLPEEDFKKMVSNRIKRVKNEIKNRKVCVRY